MVLDGHEKVIVHPKVTPIRYSLEDLNDFQESKLFSISEQNPLLAHRWWALEFDTKIIGSGLSGLLALAFRGRFDNDVIAINPFIDVLGKFSSRITQAGRKNFDNIEMIYMLHGEQNKLTMLEEWYLHGRMLGGQNTEVFWSRDCDRLNAEVVRRYFSTFTSTYFYSSYGVLEKELLTVIQKGE